jgi:NADH dehydrogenase
MGSERLAARTVIWAAGVAASPLARTLGVALDRAGRVLVGPHLEVPGRDDVWVIGDLAALTQEGKAVPGVAPAAMQGGTYVARLIARRVAGKPEPAPFHYLDKGSLATIGRASAVADLPGKIRLSGFFAWLAWGLIHVLFLIGFRNRFLVMFQWMWQWLTFQRGARLITGPLPGAEARKAAATAALVAAPAHALPAPDAAPLATVAAPAMPPPLPAAPDTL